MSQRLHRLLVVGCALIVFLQAPSALRSLREGWNGAYAVEAPRGSVSEAVVELEASRADATSLSDSKKLGSAKKKSSAIVRAGF